MYEIEALLAFAPAIVFATWWKWMQRKCGADCTSKGCQCDDT